MVNMQVYISFPDYMYIVIPSYEIVPLKLPHYIIVQYSLVWRITLESKYMYRRTVSKILLLLKVLCTK